MPPTSICRSLATSRQDTPSARRHPTDPGAPRPGCGRRPAAGRTGRARRRRRCRPARRARRSRARAAGGQALDQREQHVAAVERQERQQVEEREREREPRELLQVEPLPDGGRLLADDAHDALHVAAVAVVDEVLERRRRALGDEPELLLGKVGGTQWTERERALALDVEHEAEQALIAHLTGSLRAERAHLARAADEQRHLRRGLDRVPQLLDVLDARALDAHHDIAGPQAHVLSRRAHLYLLDRARRHVLRDAEAVERRQHDEGGEHVRGRAGHDRRDAPPHGHAPVGPRIRVLADPFELLRAPRHALGVDQLGVRRDRRGEQRDGLTARHGIAGVERRARALERRRQAVGLAGRTALGGLLGRLAGAQILAARPPHADDAHEAAQRDHADAVLGGAERALDDGGREADVELRDAHADGLGGDEVPELVDEDEGEQPADGDQRAQPGTPAASAVRTLARAPASASCTCSSALSGSREHDSSARSTSAGMSLKRQRPARNAATASSSAAFSAHGASPPAIPRCGPARGSGRHRCRRARTSA